MIEPENHKSITLPKAILLSTGLHGLMVLACAWAIFWNADAPTQNKPRHNIEVELRDPPTPPADKMALSAPHAAKQAVAKTTVHTPSKDQARSAQPSVVEVTAVFSVTPQVPTVAETATNASSPALERTSSNLMAEITSPSVNPASLVSTGPQLPETQSAMQFHAQISDVGPAVSADTGPFTSTPQAKPDKETTPETNLTAADRHRGPAVASAPPARGLPPPSAEEDTGKIRGGYIDSIRNRVETAKHYPMMARNRGFQGQPVVRFTISKNGHLLNLDLDQSSSYQILDQAALDTVRNAAPFPEIPAILKSEDLTFKLPIVFILE
jgi:protein TonB